MSVIVTTREQVAHSPINQSTAKQLFSFSKGTRFKPPKKPHEYLFFASLCTTIQPKKDVRSSMTCQPPNWNEQRLLALGPESTLPRERTVRHPIPILCLQILSYNTKAGYSASVSAGTPMPKSLSDPNLVKTVTFQVPERMKSEKRPAKMPRNSLSGLVPLIPVLLLFANHNNSASVLS